MLPVTQNCLNKILSSMAPHVNHGFIHLGRLKDVVSYTKAHQNLNGLWQKLNPFPLDLVSLIFY